MRPITILPLLIALSLAACEEKKHHKTPSESADSSAAAASDASSASGPNAADLYRKTWSRVPKDLHIGVDSVIFKDGEITLDESAAAFSISSWDDVAASLKKNRSIVEDLMKAAAMERCDWGYPASPKGMSEADLKQISETSGKRRMSERLLRADAIRAWKEGDTNAATARVIAMYGMIAQSPRDPSVLLALTDAALIQFADQTARDLSQFEPKFAAAQRQSILAAIDRLDHDDPAGIDRARKAEGKQTPEIEEGMDKSQARLTADVKETRAALK